MVWNKVKQQMESFLCPSLLGQVSYLQSGYRYAKEQNTHCYLSVCGEEVFNTTKTFPGICWYLTEQEIKQDTSLICNINEADIDIITKRFGEKIPRDRLEIIAMDHKRADCAKSIFQAQKQLFKSDFQKNALTYMSTSLEISLESEAILMNVFALVDKRLGKKRLREMKALMDMKHPVVRYFYTLRVDSYK